MTEQTKLEIFKTVLDSFPNQSIEDVLSEATKVAEWIDPPAPKSARDPEDCPIEGDYTSDRGDWPGTDNLARWCKDAKEMGYLIEGMVSEEEHKKLGNKYAELFSANRTLSNEVQYWKAEASYENWLRMTAQLGFSVVDGKAEYREKDLPASADPNNFVQPGGFKSIKEQLKAEEQRDIKIHEALKSYADLAKDGGLD